MFDSQCKFVTSVFPPLWLACIRLLFGFYALVVSVITLIWEGVKKDSGESVNSWVKFTTQARWTFSIFSIPFFQIFFLLHESILHRHLRLFLRVGCSNFCTRPKLEARQEWIPATTLATDSTIPSWLTVLDNSHLSYVIAWLHDLHRFSNLSFSDPCDDCLLGITFVCLNFRHAVFKYSIKTF